MSAEVSPLIVGKHDDLSLNESLFAHVRPGKNPVWKRLFLLTFCGSGLLAFTILYLLVSGVGVWGNNSPVAWAFDIINFVWWVGIGHAGTLISAILLLLQQGWRTSIN